MTADPGDVLPETPALMPSPAKVARYSSHGADDSLAAEQATRKAVEGAGEVAWFPDFDSAIYVRPPAPPPLVIKPSPAADGWAAEVISFVFLDLGVVKVPTSMAEKYKWETSPPSNLESIKFAEDDQSIGHSHFTPRELPAYGEPWPTETSSVEWPGLTEAIFVTEIETRAYEQNESFAARVLNELDEIKRSMSALGLSRSANQSEEAGSTNLGCYEERSQGLSDKALGLIRFADRTADECAVIGRDEAAAVFDVQYERLRSLPGKRTAGPCSCPADAAAEPSPKSTSKKSRGPTPCARLADLWGTEAGKNFLLTAKTIETIAIRIGKGLTVTKKSAYFKTVIAPARKGHKSYTKCEANEVRDRADRARAEADRQGGRRKPNRP